MAKKSKNNVGSGTPGKQYGMIKDKSGPDMSLMNTNHPSYTEINDQSANTVSDLSAPDIARAQAIKAQRIMNDDGY